MISKIGGNYFKGQHYDIYLVTGNAGRDAEDKPVNGKDHSVFSLAVQEKADGETMWINVNGWRGMYGPVRSIRKGTPVLAIGQLKSREHNGNTYYDLDAEFVAAAGGSATDNQSALLGRMASAGFGGGPVGGFAEIGEEDGELPF